MPTLQSLLQHARRVLRLAPAGATDGRLLDRFHRGDEVAFELLVWRHGPMVLSVCRRILGDEHAAEDAFQAVFLALAQKSSAIGRGEAVGAWLYRVAYRTALRARLRASRRMQRERAAGLARAQQAVPPPDAGLVWEEMRPSLDAEIARLPTEYRTAFVLCHLEGKTNEEAARELGCPVGTIQSRLSRARARLRSRLRKKGLGPEYVPFIIFIQRPQAPPDIPPSVVYGAIRSALPKASVRVAAAGAERRRSRTGPWLRRALMALAATAILAAAGAAAYAGLTSPLVPGAHPPAAANGAAPPPCSGGCHETCP